MTGNEIKFNCNNFVKLQLTELGFKIFKEHFEGINRKYKLDFETVPELDEQGYYKVQLWEAMNIFGGHLRNGMDIPFDPNIILINKEVEK